MSVDSRNIKDPCFQVEEWMKPTSKLKGSGSLYYRAVDKQGKTVDFYLSKKRDKNAAQCFFKQAIKCSGLPTKVNIDRCSANYAALQNINEGLSQGRKINIT